MWLDFTHILSSEYPLWPGTHFSVNSHTAPNKSTSSDISFNLHTGTHIDAPLHAIPGGETVADMPLERLSGKAEIIKIDGPSIQLPDIQAVSCSIVFFKTSPNIDKFDEGYCYVSPEAACRLVEMNIKIIGTDCWSVENFEDTNFTTHKILLGNNIPIVESLNLTNAEPGLYEVMIIPLLLQTEASPVRVLAKPLPCSAQP